MNIEKRIKEVDLKPSDIVKLQVSSDTKPIGLSQATGWIDNPTATKAIEQLLWRLCDEKVATGVSYDRPGKKKGGLSGKKVEKPQESKAVKGSTEHPIANPQDSSKHPDLPSATHTGFSWGDSMTAKKTGSILRLNVGERAYTIYLEKAKNGFLVEGQRYGLSDFRMV